MRARAKKNRQLKKSANGQFRLIGGQWRSRKLEFPPVEGLRPTTDRVRETVFNWLSTEIIGSRVLDLFAGSGALGFEALSRGAQKATLVELNQQAHARLNSNASLLGASATCILANALSWLEEGQGRFNLIFLDPPFRKNLVPETIERLLQSDMLEPESLVYIEMEAESELPKLPRDWLVLKDKTFGQARSLLLRVN